MKKVLLVASCLVFNIVGAMALDSDFEEKYLGKTPKSSKGHQVFVADSNGRERSLLLGTPLITNTEALGDQLEEKGLDRESDEVKARGKRVQFELGLSDFLLKNSRSLSPKAKMILEENTTLLAWQNFLDKSLSGELGKKKLKEERKREKTLSHDLNLVASDLEEIENDLLAEEIRTILPRAMHMQQVNKLRQLIRPEADGRVDSVITDSPKGRFTISSYN